MSGKDFFQLVSTCDFKKLQKFLQIIPEDDVINYQNNVGNTPLMQACNVNSPDNSQKLVKILLDVRAHVDISNQNGDRALLFAAKKGYNVVVDMLINANCEFDFINQLNQRPVDVAANEATKRSLMKLHNEKEARLRAQYVQELSYQLLDMIFQIKVTPESSQEIIEFLKKYATDYSEILEFESFEVRHKRKTLLGACVVTQNLHLLNFILQTYPKIPIDGIHTRCVGRNTPLMLNCMIPLWPTFPQSPDARIAEEIRHQITISILSHMNNIAHQDNDGMTALMKAVQNNHSNDVALIFQRFPSPISNTLDVQDKHSVTALMYAAKKKYYPIVTQLLIMQPQINHFDENGMTSLMWSAWCGDHQSTTALLEAGALTELRSQCGRTALIWAIEKNHSNVVQILLSKGADPNIILPSTGSSPLLIASRTNANETINHLITAGARLNDINSDGLTPLMWAVWNDQMNIVDTLLTNGASPLIKDRIGRCALEYSKSESISKKLHEEMIKISVEKKFL